MTAAKRTATFSAIAIFGPLPLASGCSPKIQVEAPKEPIVINMNVKIEHEIRVKVDKDLDEVFADSTLF